MRFMSLMPGTGHFYCGTCIRDDALGNALRGLGHEVEVVPLYLPLVLEHQGEEPPVQMGGINMYLQQKSRLARHLPRWLASALDRPGLLRWASRRGNLTNAPDLGPMTLSMLQGDNGRQALEVDKLVSYARSTERPDVIVLSNVMLTGVARRLKRELGCPVVVTLQGEAPFLDALPAPFSEQSWRELRNNAADVDAFVPVSNHYGALMRERLGVEADRVHVVHNGLDLPDLQAEPRPLAQRLPPTFGYLSRMCRDKGLPVLVYAFALLLERMPEVRLRVAGAMLREDRALVDQLRKRLGDRAEFTPNIARADKLAFLQSLSVLSVPATYGESFGLYILEALAAGVPVVQPRHGPFPEVLDATGGGALCEPDDAASLAAALERMLVDQEHAQELATHGRHRVLEHFTAERMAREFEGVCRMATGR